MGAVFALYSAWYYWIPKMTGVLYNITLAKMHFWIFFVGVNITFFPQHFLGLQGMPRRISDYPDAFAGWNMISSLGSLVSVIATWLFLYVLYAELVKGKAIQKYIWHGAQFYSDTLKATLERSFSSLEWGLESPPKPHAFESLPAQSFNFVKISSFFKIILKNITLSRLIVALMVFIGVASVKFFYFGSGYNLSTFADFCSIGLPSLAGAILWKGITEHLKIIGWDFSLLDLFNTKVHLGGPVETSKLNAFKINNKATNNFAMDNSSTNNNNVSSSEGNNNSGGSSSKRKYPFASDSLEENSKPVNENRPIKRPRLGNRTPHGASSVIRYDPSVGTPINTSDDFTVSIPMSNPPGTIVPIVPRPVTRPWGTSLRELRESPGLVSSGLHWPGSIRVSTGLQWPQTFYTDYKDSMELSRERRMRELLNRAAQTWAAEREAREAARCPRIQGVRFNPDGFVVHRPSPAEVLQETFPAQNGSEIMRSPPQSSLGDTPLYQGRWAPKYTKYNALNPLFRQLDNGTGGRVPSYGYGMPTEVRSDFENTPDGEDNERGLDKGLHGSGFRVGGELEDFQRRWYITPMSLLINDGGMGELTHLERMTDAWLQAKEYLASIDCWTDLREHWFVDFRIARERQFLAVKRRSRGRITADTFDQYFDYEYGT